ncbi:restriction endonuclease subunit S [Enterococcus casseliflavus]|uniref:restriction endonuclease subunit S n=1 Tax=Enterococcus casseliflavus TaxID=37734 RepID=UPI0029530156|nr:restriction endonuclease subunit S [Enterococcus casseliflavus]MDV7701200.1 restriction endonuclease subunit S [Enterococcus casseliflavus]
MSNDTRPEIRFPGFTEDWEERKLGDESDVRDGTHDSPKYYDKGYPLVTSKNLKDFGLDLSNVSFISDEDFEVINKRSKVDIGDILFGMIGTIGNPVLVDRADFAIKNVALIKEQKKILNSFLIQILKSPVFDKYIKNENAGGTQKFLSLSKVRDFNFLCPNIDEQYCISAFFKKLDDTIALHQRKLDLLKETKKGFLQKMFPKNGAKVPEIRFPGFTEDWEQRKLGQVANYRRGSFPQPYGNKEWYDGENSMPFVQVVDVGDNLRLVEDTKQKISELAQPKSVFVEEGKVVVTLQGSIGRVAITQYPAYVDRTLLIFESYKAEMDEYYFAYVIQQLFEYEKTRAPGGTIKTITKEALSNFTISFPSIAEQKKLGKFFEQLDDTIALHQRKLDLLKETKKGFLQKMFV